METPTQQVFQRYQFVVLAPNAWQGQWMNRQQLFSRIALFTKTLYSRGLPYVWEIKSVKALLDHAIGHVERADGVLLDLPSSLIFRCPRFPRLSRWMLHRHGRQLTGLLDADKPVVLYIFHPRYADYIDVIDHNLLIYHPFDDFFQSGTSNDLLAVNEKRLVNEADLVATPSSDVTANLTQRYGRKEIHTINNGVSFADFAQGSQLTCPPDLANIQGPRVGYIGSINRKVDLALLDFLSRELPHIQLVLIGPVTNLDNKKSLLEQLRQRSNVHFLGSRDYRQLPAYAGHMDCHLMCYDTSPALWARLAYPLKLNEYLATRKPLVSCPLNSVDDQESLMDVCDSPSSWRDAIEARLAAPSPKLEPGFVYASKQDWEKRVDQLAALLDECRPGERKTASQVGSQPLGVEPQTDIHSRIQG